MKLRLRQLESKETFQIEAPNSCDLPALKRILAQELSISPSLASIRLSFNRKDEILSDGQRSLQSLGIASGDLIFFSVEQHPYGNGSSSCLVTRNAFCESQNYNSVIVDSQEGKIVGNGSQIEKSEDETGNNSITVDVDEKLLMAKLQLPDFLRKVFMDQLDHIGRRHKFVIIAIHAIMVESGFVGFYKNTNKVVCRYQFQKNWSVGLAGASLFYTLPESINSRKKIYTVVLKFQCSGNFVNVYGTLRNGSSKRGTYWVQFNEDQLVPFLNVKSANGGVTNSVSCISSSTKEVFKFWRSVKDNITLPLLIDLCEEAGLELPPCFMRLPTDIKLKILGYLNGVELARVCCVSLEMWYLGSSNNLWWLKFNEEFGNGNGKERKEKESQTQTQTSWKNEFAILWDREKNGNSNPTTTLPEPYWPQLIRRYPNPLMVPRNVGVEYDVVPFGHNLQTWLHEYVDHPMRNLSPPCNLGGRGRRFF